jgi:predicted nucleic acid-binding protein
VRTLLDTCVLSELRRPQGDPRVFERVDELDPSNLYLSAITLGELTKGVVLLPEGQRKREIASWLLGLEQQFTEHILPVDHDVARLWGELSTRARLQGVRIPANDGLIAATAIRHGLHVMTRNAKHFAASGALIIDPWQD